LTPCDTRARRPGDTAERREGPRTCSAGPFLIAESEISFPGTAPVPVPVRLPGPPAPPESAVRGQAHPGCSPGRMKILPMRLGLRDRREAAVPGAASAPAAVEVVRRGARPLVGPRRGRARKPAGRPRPAAPPAPTPLRSAAWPGSAKDHPRSTGPQTSPD